MKIQRKPEDLAYLSEALPSNATPFLNRMKELIQEYGNDAQKSNEYKACLWVIMAQTYTPISVVPLSEEWSRLRRIVNSL